MSCRTERERQIYVQIQPGKGIDTGERRRSKEGSPDGFAQIPEGTEVPLVLTVSAEAGAFHGGRS